MDERSLDRSKERRETKDDKSFSEALLHAFEVHEAGGLPFVITRQEEVEVDRAMRDDVEKLDLNVVLREFLPDTPVAFKEAPELKGYTPIYTIPIKYSMFREQLPKGYAFAGGAARALLLRNLGIDPIAMPRDVDIVRVVEEEPEPGMDQRLSRQYMGDDCQDGFGVRCENLSEGYFFTRDLTINEVIADQTTIYASQECLLDTARRIIRLTDFERKKLHEGGDGYGKMLAKAVRFFAEMIERYDRAEINDPDLTYEQGFISPFWMAVHLDRALEQGDAVAKRYLDLLISSEHLPNYINTLEEAIEYLQGKIFHTDFYFRHAPKEQFEHERDLVEGKFADLPERESMHRRYTK